ncbi:hypothetical protein EIW49_18400 [Salmonella enterica subsp. enterica serovar Heidelberg]|nr:hypothetical protein [Salmonella enterica subsp. enterica serovar Heidelberg]ECA1902905.1 hypothetical protein [Salmonella enterica subsp. enterica serovar Heidelberg]
MMIANGINTVVINGESKHITELDSVTLCNEWAKMKREVEELYEYNRKANSGLRGIILRFLGIKLPFKKTVFKL